MNLIERTLTINKNLIFVGDRGSIKHSPKSEAGNRTIPIPDILFGALRDYLPTVESIYVFPSAKNEIMSEVAYRRFWDKVLLKLNEATGGTNGRTKVLALANDITPHIFRHTYATMLYYAGVDMKTASIYWVTQVFRQHMTKNALQNRCVLI